MVGALLLPSFSPSLFLSPTPLSTSKRRGGPARFYFVQPSQLSHLTLPPFAIKDKFKARQARAKLVIIIIRGKKTRGHFL